MLDAAQHLPLGGPIARQFVGDEHPWHVLAALQYFAEELLGGGLIAAALHQNIQAIAVLIHRAPEIVRLAIDFEEHLVG